ncbi:MAG: hypothetical protein Q8J89_07095 [Caulobacter sp.]|nr:hypothetical protein [Caulobacter sp.]
MRKLFLSAAVAACVLAGPTAAPAFQPTPPAAGELGVTEGERTAFRTGMIASGGAMVSAIIKRYPTEYRAFETSIIADFKAGRVDIATAQARAGEFFGLLGDRMMTDVQRAPDADLRALVAAQVATLKTFSVTNARACQEFGENGQISTATAVAAKDSIIPAMNDYVAVQLATADAGARAKVRRAKLADAEMDLILKEFLRRGGSQVWLDGAGTGDFGDLTVADRCQASILLLESVLAQPPATVGRFMGPD